MIFSIEGKVGLKGDHYLVLEVAGFGYQVFVTDFLLDRIKPADSLKLFTYLYLKEETIELYGFESQEELEFFKQLNALPTIGPKTAINVFSLTKLPDLKKAILEGNVSLLTRVSGVGEKTAERIILEMKSQIKKMKGKISQQAGDEDVLEALLRLGYSLHQVREVLRKLPEKIETPEKRLKEALKILGKS